MNSLYNDILSLPASHLLCLAEFGSKDNMGSWSVTVHFQLSLVCSENTWRVGVFGGDVDEKENISQTTCDEATMRKTVQKLAESHFLKFSIQQNKKWLHQHLGHWSLYFGLMMERPFFILLLWMLRIFPTPISINHFQWRRFNKNCNLDFSKSIFRDFFLSSQSQKCISNARRCKSWIIKAASILVPNVVEWPNMPWKKDEI